MLKSFTITNNDFEFGTRLVPSYYYYSKVIKIQNQKEGINYVKLEEIAKKISDGEHSHIPRNKDAGVRYLYGRNIKEGIINFDPISDDSYIHEEDYNKFKRTHISEGDVLISIYGTIGKSAIYKKDYVGVAGIPRHISNITLKEDSPVSAEFITAFFRSKYGKWQLHNITTGNIQQLLSLKNIRKLDIPLPNEGFLEMITLKESQAIQCEIEALDLLKQAEKYFYEKIDIDFSDMDKGKYSTIDFNRLKEEDLWIPKNFKPLYLDIDRTIKNKWPTRKIKEITSTKNGDEIGSANYIEYLETTERDVPFIRTSDIVNHEVDQFSDFYAPVETYKDIDQDLKTGDVLFAKDGKIGVTALITDFDKAIIASGFTRLRLNDEGLTLNLTPEYLFLIMSIKETGLFPALRKTVIASTIPHLRVNRLVEIEIPILDLESINKITRLVKRAFDLKDKKKNLIKEVKDEIDKYFKVKDKEQ